MFDPNLSASLLLKTPAGKRVTTLLRKQQRDLGPFIQEIHEEIADIAKVLVPEASYTTKALCGDLLWDSYSIGVRRAAGICLAHIVKTGELPLRLATKEGVYPHRYRLSLTEPQHE